MKAILIIFYVFFYIITSPYQLYKIYKNIKFRKNIKVGDRAFFINVQGTKTYGKVEIITEDGLKAGFGSLGIPYSYQFIDINLLKII